MTKAERRLLHAFLETAPWQRQGARMVATVWMGKESIHPDAFPKTIRVDEILWHHQTPEGLVPVRILRAA